MSERDAPERTPGRWCQFHGNYCEEAKGTDYRQWDTSHDVSAILPDGTRYKVAHFRHARDAAFVEQLVNGHATLTADRDRLARALDTWVSARKAAMENVTPETWRALADAEAGLVAARAALQGETP